MGAADDGWRQSETLAWVEHDAPRPPLAGRSSRLVLAAALGAVVAGMLATDTLCPEHRAWVLVIGTTAIAAAVTAFVALLRASWISMPLTLGSAVGGVAIGLIDATHDATRGSVIAVAFAAISLMALGLLAADLRRLRWDAALRPFPEEASVPSLDRGAPSADPASADEPEVPSEANEPVTITD